MTSTRCIHGLDSRFCANCNRVRTPAKVSRATGAKTSRSGSSGSRTSRTPASAPLPERVTPYEILAFLNEAKTRATYGAVAGVLGVPAQSVGSALGNRRPEASWVVNADTSLPTDYEQADWHPDLLVSSTIISSNSELALRLAAWRGRKD